MVRLATQRLVTAGSCWHPWGWRDKGRGRVLGTWESQSADRSRSHGGDVGEATDAGDAAQGKGSGGETPWFLPFSACLAPSGISHWLNRGQSQSSLGNVVPCHTEQSKRGAADGSERRQTNDSTPSLAKNPPNKLQTPQSFYILWVLFHPFAGLLCHCPPQAPVQYGWPWDPCCPACCLGTPPHSMSSARKAFLSSHACVTSPRL